MSPYNERDIEYFDSLGEEPDDREHADEAPELNEWKYEDGPLEDEEADQ
jgi:hypothetical protein